MGASYSWVCLDPVSGLELGLEFNSLFESHFGLQEFMEYGECSDMCSSSTYSELNFDEAEVDL